MKRVVSVIALVAAIACLAASVAQAKEVGAVVSFLSPQHGALATDLGVGWVRVNFTWNEIELTQGTFTFTDQYAWVDEAARRGLKIFATVSGWRGATPSWGLTCSGSTCYPRADKYGLLMDAIFQDSHFYGKGIVWGIWNEPNLDNYALTESRYADLFAAASASRYTYASSEVLAGPEVSHHGSTYYYNAMYYMASSMSSSDIVTAHWYTDSSATLNNWGNYLALYAGSRALWMTETGKDSCDDYTQLTGIMGIESQYALSTSPFSNLFFYVMHAPGGSTCSNHGYIDSFSLTNNDGSPRDAFNSIKSFNDAQTPPPERFVGCYSDTSTRALPIEYGSGYTIETCVAAARSDGYAYAGLQYYGYCFAGNTLGYTQTDDGDCDTPCSLDAGEMCGGVWLNSIFLAGDGSGGGGAMQADSAITGGCENNYDSPVYQPTPEECSSYCSGQGADTCEWYSGNGDCYVEHGSGCSVIGGYSGWYAEVFH